MEQNVIGLNWQMVKEKQKREQTGPGQDKSSGQMSITDLGGTVLLWAGLVPSGNQRQNSMCISNMEFQAGLGCDADCIQINTFSGAE